MDPLPAPSLWRLVVAGLRTAAAILFVSTYTLVTGPVGIVLASVFRWPMVLYYLGLGGVRGALFLSGLRFTVEGTEHIRADGPAVYCVNHASNVEPPILYCALRRLFPRLQILYKAEIHKIPILAHGFDIVGFVPIERGNRERSALAIDQAVRQIRAGNSFLVFPEGTRSRTGELLPFKKGAFMMAMQAEAPVVPVAIEGSHAAMRKGSPVIWPVTIRIKFGPAVATAGLAPDERDRVIADVRLRVSTLLHELRASRRSAA
ncbi:MAG: lysophospholipid acyltransferase family protein [Vicinamibacterales bacterium]